jgi:hypothetical protein
VVEKSFNTQYLAISEKSVLAVHTIARMGECPGLNCETNARHRAREYGQQGKEHQACLRAEHSPPEKHRALMTKRYSSWGRYVWMQ